MAKTGTWKARLRLRLYVAGNAPNSVNAIANAKSICDQHFASNHELEIIDLIEHPIRGLADGIVVTPTLVRMAPEPKRKVIGNLGDMTHVLTVLVNK
ncbi:MAG: circadian clock KaiB family protein [Gemmatimonadota bacterium]